MITLQGVAQQRFINEQQYHLFRHKTCISDAIKVWNGIPNTLKQNKTLCTMKKATKSYVKTLPI